MHRRVEYNSKLKFEKDNPDIPPWILIAAEKIKQWEGGIWEKGDSKGN